MSLKMTNRQVDGVTVVDLNGKITIGQESAQLRQTIQNLASKGNRRILFNLGEVSYIDSTGLGELVRGFVTVSRQGGTLKLLSLTRKVHDLLQIVKLHTIFEIFDDENQAIQSFEVEAGSDLRATVPNLSPNLQPKASRSVAPPKPPE